ncbi:hypothetical protein NQ314_000582 [Rhamnusium bicolor]|uniref:Nose resistant-to-fluoxetine protein N-terminal domain-containing protein n=1 Tax=Rhamnusium bicolor TaxID=1586634 RepID=A0AAV8ZU96_9CUCU|nr:hypothetical protein NQ314_000582 [Rhamnusium bicolor]
MKNSEIEKEIISLSNENVINSKTQTAPEPTHEATTITNKNMNIGKTGTEVDDEMIIKKQRKYVKLTMKQGLIMNQVISTYALADIKNSLCKNHSEEFKLGLRALEPWALQMFDSSSKIASGILNGNLVEYGAYRQCLNIYKNTEYGPIRGRHCSFRVTPTEKLMKIVLSFRNVSEKRFELLSTSVMDGVNLIWSVCVPDSCHRDDVFPHFNKTIVELTEGLDLAVSLKEEHCVSLEDEPKLNIADYLAILFIGTIIMTVLVTSVIDFSNKGKSNCFVSSFSAYSNGKRLFSTKSNDLELECLNGLRYLSICYVVVGHRYIQNMAFPVVNSIDLIDCIVQVWYLTDDMIFYYLSPMIIIPLWKWPKFGYINFVVIYIVSIVSSFWIAWSNMFGGEMPIT